MPHPLELPGMLRTVVKLMRGERLAGFRRHVIDELVARSLRRTWRRRFTRRRSRLKPCFAPIVGALNNLPEPSARLRHIQPIRIRGRSLDVINLPPRKMRAANLPPLPLAVRRQDERALARTDQNSYLAHAVSLDFIPLGFHSPDTLASTLQHQSWSFAAWL